MRTTRLLASLVLILACLPACRSWDRLARGVGGGAAPAEERINLWPLYYQDGELFSLAWPLYDQDDKGFALRPLAAVDGSRGEVLWPWISWNAEAGDWAVLPVYRRDGELGVFPVYMHGSWGTFAGPVYWHRDEQGEIDRHAVFPFYYLGDGEGVVLNYIWQEETEVRPGGWVFLPLAAAIGEWRQAGPLYWHRDTDGSWDTHGLAPFYHHSPELTVVGPAYWLWGEDGEAENYGIFPLFHIGAQTSFLGPALWARDAEGELSFALVVPAFGYGKKDDGSAFYLTPLGGQGWDAEGNTTFANILGPVYHYQRSEEQQSHNVLWPLFSRSTGPQKDSWALWPLYGESELRQRPKEGEETAAVLENKRWALAGLVRHRARPEGSSLRVFPLFSHAEPGSGGFDFADYLSLYGRDERKNSSSGHIGTPLLFSYSSGAARSRWQSLLGTCWYEREDEESEFRLLYYLYRQRNRPERTEVDLFPFVSWSTGEQAGGFSFFWRLFNYQRRGEKSGGHILFIPWGDH